MAWLIARKAAAKHGGSTKQYFSESLKLSWKSYKEVLLEKKSDIMGFAAWWIKKKFGEHFVEIFNNSSQLEVVKQTKSAYFIKQTQFNTSVIVTNTFWAPKSVCC